MKKSILLFISAALIFSLTLCSCSETASAQREAFAMDTYMTLTACGENADAALEAAVTEIKRLDSLLSVTDEGSDIWRINHAEGSTVAVSDETLQIIKAAADIGEKTGGALDITVYPVEREWGFTTGEYKLPDNDTLTSLLENVDFTQIKTDGSSVTVPQGFQLDLGSVAKGYAADRAVEILKEYGAESAIINLGGDVQTLGAKPDGSPWKIAVRNPFQTDENLCTISVEDKAVVTSGNYERYFTDEDGKRYCHIIDPKSGYPADSGIVSATVIGDSGLICDALSTALFVMGTEKALEYWQEQGGFEMILVSTDGEIYISSGIAEAFENLSDMQLHIVEK